MNRLLRSSTARAAIVLCHAAVSPADAAPTDSIVVFNEIMYHPAAADSSAELAAEWIELRNQMAVDIDLSRWSLGGGLSFTFPEGTIVPGGGFIVVAANPLAGGITGALGPWSGRLDNGGERIALRDNNGRTMDEVDYGTTGEWPAGPDGGGPSLAKRARNLASPEAASWRSSARVGGTPDAENFPAFETAVSTPLVTAGAVWKFRGDGTDLGTAWTEESAGEAGFVEAPTVFQLGSDPLPGPAAFGTALPSGPTTYYFRRNFSFSGQVASATLQLRLLVDDGAAVFLNGSELSRLNLPVGAAFGSPALTPRRASPVWREFDVSAAALHVGSNVLAAEVHQAAVLPAYPAAVIASAPVAYWRLGENVMAAGAVSDLADLPAAPESGGQHGSIVGMAAANLATPGPRPTDLIGGQPLLGFEATNAAPAFQGNNGGGNDVVVVPDPGPLNFAAGRKFTLEAWVKAPAAQEDGGAIIAKGGGGGGEQFAIDIVGGTFRFFHWDAVTPAVVNSSIPPNNSWQHIVAVLDSAGGTMLIYVNGAQTGSGTPRATMLSHTHELSIGARKNSGSSAYDLNLNGTVDEVAVYDRVLSPAEITAHYDAAFASGGTGVDTTDAVFAAELTATESVPAGAPLSLSLNEVSTSEIEMMNTGPASVDLTGCALLRVTPAGSGMTPLPAQTLPAGGFLTLPLGSNDGDRVVLFAGDGTTVLDSFEVKSTPRGRHPDGSGAWLRPTAATPNAANAFALHDEIVINEIMFDHPSATLLTPGASQPQQWIELFNKSGIAVDLSGWRLNGGVEFAFPAGSALAAGGYLVIAENPAAVIAGHGLPATQVLGPWSGELSHGSDRLVLEDAVGNPADEVRFYSEGRWPVAANAGGSSLELRDSAADNNVAESWAASDESGKAAWQTFTWSGPNVVSQSGEPTMWREIALLLVDGPGECLVDDVRVTDMTTSANLIQNGDFNAGASHWRMLGNHRKSRVEPEPGNPGNSVLRVIASGPGEYQGNQIESTFVGNTALVAGRTYEVSLRARWIEGGGRLNTRLYFNRLPRTNLLAVVPNGGTPGAPNSRLAPNIGPALGGLAHAPVVPLPGQPVTIKVEAADPNGVAGVDLKFSVAGVAWQTAGMTSSDGRHYSGTIPGAASGTIQFYVEARDTSGATSVFPARGVESRALIQINDGQATGMLQTVRLVMTAAEATYLHTGNNTLSNELLGATVVVGEREVFYDVGVRLKGSFVGRNVPRVGFTIRFNSDHLFRGVHDRLAIDRSQHAAVGQGEIIAKHIANHAGGIPGMYDDLARFIHPQTAYTSACQLRTTGFDAIYLDSQFPNGSDGTMFEIEVIRWHTQTTNGNPESPKVVGPNAYANLELRDWGNDKEAYRWTALQTMNRDRDDFAAMIALEKMMGGPGGAGFLAETQRRLDHEQWLRTLAYQALVGPADAVYTGSNLHNYRVCFRPHDGRSVYLPWDWDSSFQNPTNGPLVGASNLARLVTVSPDTMRRYRCHLFDIIQSTYNQSYMTRWTQHYGQLAGQDLSGILGYIAARSSFVLSQLPTATAFSATAGVPNANGAVTVTGNANIRVAFIEINGLAYTPTWTSTTAWTVVVPLATGPNTLVIRGLDKNLAAVTGATATINVDNPNQPGWAPLRINEWLAENDGSFRDPADEASDDWFEIHNPTAQPVDVSGWKLSDRGDLPGLFVIPNGWTIAPNGFLLVWADDEAAQNPAVPTASSQLHCGFKLDNAGESIIVSAPDGREIDRVDFGLQTADDSEGRYADGAAGIFRLTVPTPAAPNVMTEVVDLSILAPAPQLEVSSTPGWVYRLESSTDLSAWIPWAPPVTATGPTVIIPAVRDGPQRFLRVRTGD